MNVLKKITEELDVRFPVAQFSKDLDYSKGVISQYLNGKRELSENFKRDFENFYKIKFSDFENKEVNNSGQHNQPSNLIASSNNSVDTFINTNGNKYYIYDNGTIEIEVVNIPFPAYASYLEVYERAISIGFF